MSDRLRRADSEVLTWSRWAQEFEYLGLDRMAISSRNPKTTLQRKLWLAILLIGGGIAVHAFIIVAATKLGIGVDELAGEFDALYPGASLFFWGPLMASPAFVLTRLGLAIWSAATGESYQFSPFLLSIMLGLLSLPVSLFLFGLSGGKQDIGARIVISFGFAIVLSWPMLIAMAITIPAYISRGTKRGAPIYILLAFCVAIEFLWLMLFFRSFAGMSI